MITIENFIVDKVNTAIASLKTTYPNIKVVSDYIETSETFPLVSVVESDNYTHLATQDAALVDHAANVSFEINIFANDKKKKSTAKNIAAVVDATMLSNLFRRRHKNLHGADPKCRPNYFPYHNAVHGGSVACC